jgi:hypothetical protein
MAMAAIPYSFEFSIDRSIDVGPGKSQMSWARVLVKFGMSRPQLTARNGLKKDAQTPQFNSASGA